MLTSIYSDFLDFEIKFVQFSDMEDLFDFDDQNNTLGCNLNFDSLFDCNYPYEPPKSSLKNDQLPTTSSNVAEENRLDDIEIDQGLNDANFHETSFDFGWNLLDEKACKDPTESSFGGVS